MEKFNCKKCGRCCDELQLEIVELDLIRESRLKLFAEPLNGEWDKDNPFDKVYALPSPCPFKEDNKCTIYATRPNLCVAFSDKCLNIKII
jgi:Fe-S-cluster containining protein